MTNHHHRYCALLLVTVSSVLIMLYYTSVHVIPGDHLPWKPPESRIYMHTNRSSIEVEEADNQLGSNVSTSGGLTNSSVEKPKERETSPLQKFHYYARQIPEESVAEKKFLADQAAVQSVPTEAPGWVYNKTGADLFRKRLVGDSRFANGNFLVTQQTVNKSGLMTHSENHDNITVPEKVFNGFPKESPFKNKHFNTCSVVGNGGILKGSGCGKEIDASEFVFRFNMAPMGDKYSRDIVNKTNLITINPSMIDYRYTKGKGKGIDVKSLTHDLSAYRDSYLWIWALLSQSNARSAFKVQEALQGASARNQVNVIFPYPLVTGAIISFWKKHISAQRPSSGLLLASLATQMCEEVRLYGFWPFHADRNNRRLTQHYYGNALPTKVHKIPLELRQLQILHNNGIVRLTTHPCQ
ncbi:PREDICTED: alpha-N-acetylneuraminide alpha-2,8-sialyltransferase-like isoform X1 [Branchiostoma belcheri]|uniref:Alpha-N-acetylneuraminide alpha-2,8-sialyltransferase-like isoform X1 n=1 Tax=Branchiostoma belcheri TaxID=7741 RepID=A0A6P4Y9J2_BRABE|nr:PREDICTED: alpha-N-acetylneuraminide alpha-2,8-sialyltransferase-like isoform X1 [Branchiostoma belcheri]